MKEIKKDSDYEFWRILTKKLIEENGIQQSFKAFIKVSESTASDETIEALFGEIEPLLKENK